VIAVVAIAVGALLPFAALFAGFYVAGTLKIRREARMARLLAATPAFRRAR